MHVALISIGNCPSLALHNLKCYCSTHEDVGGSVSFQIHDLDIREFRDTRAQSSRQWSFVTRFDEVIKELVESNPDVIGFSCYLWNVELSLHLAYLVKRLMTEAFIVLGGPDPGPRAPELLRLHPQIDGVVEGDGEIPFLQLLRQLLTGNPDLSKVPALHYRDGTRVIANPASSETVDMSVLRDVYDRIPSPQELDRWYYPSLLYETMRGCPFLCSYCMYGRQPVNQKDPALVVEELAALLDRGLAVEIIDPTFTTYKRRAKEILRGLAEHDASGSWSAPGQVARSGLCIEAYPDSIDEEMVELMAATVGCVGIGFQTLSTEGLKAVKRPRNLARFEHVIRLLQSHSINFYVDVIYGLPQTTADDFVATVDYLHSLEIPDLVIYRLLGLPGSPMMDDPAEHRLVFNESPPYELLESNSFSLEDILFCERFNRAYDKLHGYLRTDQGRRLTAGGVSPLVRRFMTVEHGDPRAFMQTLAYERWRQEKTLGTLGTVARGAFGDATRKVLAAARRRASLVMSGSLS